MKKAPKTQFLDKLHRGAVWTCIGLTIYGTCLLSHRLYHYYFYMKPKRIEMEKIEQTSNDTLIDHSPKLRT